MGLQLEDLPDDLILYCAKTCKPLSLAALSCCSRRLRELLAPLWRALYLRLIGESASSSTLAPAQAPECLIFKRACLRHFGFSVCRSVQQLTQSRLLAAALSSRFAGRLTPNAFETISRIAKRVSFSGRGCSSSCRHGHWRAGAGKDTFNYETRAVFDICGPDASAVRVDASIVQRSARSRWHELQEPEIGISSLRILARRFEAGEEPPELGTLDLVCSWRIADRALRISSSAAVHSIETCGDEELVSAAAGAEGPAADPERAGAQGDGFYRGASTELGEVPLAACVELCSAPFPGGRVPVFAHRALCIALGVQLCPAALLEFLVAAALTARAAPPDGCWGGPWAGSPCPCAAGFWPGPDAAPVGADCGPVFPEADRREAALAATTPPPAPVRPAPRKRELPQCP
eukprot:tig00020961_g16714.t1